MAKYLSDSFLFFPLNFQWLFFLVPNISCIYSDKNSGKFGQMRHFSMKFQLPKYDLLIVIFFKICIYLFQYVRVAGTTIKKWSLSHISTKEGNNVWKYFKPVNFNNTFYRNIYKLYRWIKSIGNVWLKVNICGVHSVYSIHALKSNLYLNSADNFDIASINFITKREAQFYLTI